MFLGTFDNGTIRRVGGLREIHVDVKIIAATNKILSHETKKGAFREDLYYRLNSMHIEIPPLHERRYDIPSLVLFFSVLYALDNNKDDRTIKNLMNDKTMHTLEQYHWPGNVRQLRGFVDMSMALDRPAWELIEYNGTPPKETVKALCMKLLYTGITPKTIKHVLWDVVPEYIHETTYREETTSMIAQRLGVHPKNLYYHVDADALNKARGKKI